MLSVSVVLLAIGAAILALAWPHKASGNVPSSPALGLDGVIKKWASVRGIPAALIKAVIRKESNFNVRAHNGDDPGLGAFGLMQVVVQPGSWDDVLDEFNKAYGKRYSHTDLFTADVNIEVGSWYLARLVKKYGFDMGVEMYNVGESGYQKLGRRNDAYRRDVMKNYQTYLAA